MQWHARATIEELWDSIKMTLMGFGVSFDRIVCLSIAQTHRVKGASMRHYLAIVFLWLIVPLFARNTGFDKDYRYGTSLESGRTGE